MESTSSDSVLQFFRMICKVLTLGIFLSLTACNGGDTETVSSGTLSKTAASIAVAPNIVVTGITKISEIRVSRTVYDYVFKVTFKNNSAVTQNGIAATVITVGPGATVQDGLVNVGNLVAGGTTIPSDTITIRQDRTQPFSEAMLSWNITVSGSPPPDDDISGLDADNDGVRDDVQAFVVAKFSSAPDRKSVV